MENATCTFNIVNDGKNEISLYVEPEGAEFSLPAGKTVQVRLFGKSNPIQMNQSIDDSGRTTISFWPEHGEYELLFEGQDIWDHILREK